MGQGIIKQRMYIYPSLTEKKQILENNCKIAYQGLPQSAFPQFKWNQHAELIQIYMCVKEEHIYTIHNKDISKERSSLKTFPAFTLNQKWADIPEQTGKHPCINEQGKVSVRI